MNNVVFTIVAQNYIGLAKILRESFLKHNPKDNFHIFVADDYKKEDDVTVSRDVLDIPADKWQEMSFKYDITEFCTSIKPFCFEYLFVEKGYDNVVYLDPDIFLFDSFDTIFETLDSYSFYLIPHLVLPDADYDGERVYLQSGIYNLGFIGMHRSENSFKFIKWWGNKLLDNCFDDLISYTFTDQKWANYIPSFYPQDVFVSIHLGMNVAPWNFHERLIESDGGKFYVKSRKCLTEEKYPLVFVHYSGFDYKGLLTGTVVRNRRGGYEQFEDLHLILDVYEQALKASSKVFLEYINLPYTYGSYSNGEKIDKLHRRMFRQLVLLGRDAGNPFDSANSLFYAKVAKLGMIKKESVNRMDVEDVANIDGKLSLYCSFMKLVYRIIGYKRYIQLLKLLKYFSRSESQAFLLDSEMKNHILSV